MPRFFQTLALPLRRHGFMILWCCLVIAYLLWLFVISKPYEATLGISSEVFSIFCGSVATVSGVLLGLVIATVAFVVQSSFSSLSANTDILLREGQWLESWLSGETVKDVDFVRKLQKLCKLFKSPLMLGKEIHSNEVANIWSNVSESVGNMISALKSNVDEHLKRLDKLDKLEAKIKSKTGKEEALKLEEEVRRTGKEIQSLHDLMHHASVAFTSVYVLLDLRFSGEMRKVLIYFAYVVSTILIASLIFLGLSGIEFSGVELVSNFNRLNVAIFLGLAFLPILPLLFRIVTIHLEIVSRDGS